MIAAAVRFAAGLAALPRRVEELEAAVDAKGLTAAAARLAGLERRIGELEARFGELMLEGSIIEALDANDRHRRAQEASHAARPR